MSRTTRFLAGLRIGFVGQVLPAVVAIVTTPLLLRLLGQRSLGLWLIATQIVTYLAIADFGVLALMSREVSIAFGREQARLATSSDAPTDEGATAAASSEVGRVVSEARTLVMAQLPIVAIGACAVWLALPDRWSGLRGPLGIYLVAFVVAYPLRLSASILYGLQEFAIVGRLSLGTWALGTGITLAGAYAGIGLYALALGAVAQQVVHGALAFVWLRLRRAEVFRAPRPALSRSLARAWLGRSVWILVAQVTSMFLTGSDLLILGALAGPEAVVVYACTGKLVQLCVGQVNAIAITAAPGFAELRGRGDHEALARVLSVLVMVMLVVSGGCVAGIVAVNGAFVSVWLTAAQYGGIAMTALMASLMLARHVNLALAQAVFAAGNERPAALVGLTNGVVSLGVTALAARFLGAWAVPIGGLVGVLCVSLPANLYMAHRAADVRMPSRAAMFGSFALRAIPALALATGLGLFVHPTNFIGVALVGAAAASGYAALVGPLLARPPLVDYVKPRVERLRASLRARLGRAH